MEPEEKAALHIAYAAGNMIVVKILLKVGVNPEVKDAEGMTPVQLLALHPQEGETYIDFSHCFHHGRPPMPPLHHCHLDP